MKFPRETRHFRSYFPEDFFPYFHGNKIATHIALIWTGLHLERVYSMQIEYIYWSCRTICDVLSIAIWNFDKYFNHFPVLSQRGRLITFIIYKFLNSYRKRSHAFYLFWSCHGNIVIYLSLIVHCSPLDIISGKIWVSSTPTVLFVLNLIWSVVLLMPWNYYVNEFFKHLIINASIRNDANNCVFHNFDTVSDTGTVIREEDKCIFYSQPG